MSAILLATSIKISNKSFLEVVFFQLLFLGGPVGGVVWINHIGGTREDWSGESWREEIEFDNESTFFCISAFKPDADGKIARRKQYFAGLYCLVLDDVGTKVDASQIHLPPSWKLETSPGNFQWGYLLDIPILDISKAESLMQAVIGAGLCDKGASGPTTRYMRLPVGSNSKPGVMAKNGGKPFQHRVHEWNPSILYSSEDLIAGLGLTDERAGSLVPCVDDEAHLSHELVVASQNMTSWIKDIRSGENYHDATLRIAGSLASRGTPHGAITVVLRAEMEASEGLRDDRWRDRYNDIPRMVRDGVAKYAPASVVVSPLKPLTLQALLALPQPNWLIKGVIPANGLGVLFGESGSGKTFIALDLALTVARGPPWRGKRVERAGVIYLAAEGAYGLSRRVKAYQKYHDVDLSNVPFGVIPTALNLLEGEDDQRLIAACAEMETQGQRVGLIVIDTLNRVMPGGNENSPDDMGAFIGHADAIAKATGAFVLIVHHSGKDAAKGARGHSSLRAAVDTELELKRDGEVRVLTLSKSREGEDGIQFAFRLEQVELGIDDDLDPISSCVAIAADVSDAKSKQPKPQGKWQACVYDVAKKLEIVHPIDGQSVTREEILNEIKKIQHDLPQRWKESADRAIDELTAKKLIEVFAEALV